MSYTYEWPRPALTVDIAVIAKRSAVEATRILLIERKNDPFKGHWALPGGFVDENEPIPIAASRELQEETSVDPKHVNLVQIGAYGDPGRDPRGWTVSVLFGCLIESSDIGVKAADDAANADWINVTQLPTLAFDHKVLIRDAFQHLLKSAPQGTTKGDLEAALQSESLKDI